MSAIERFPFIGVLINDNGQKFSQVFETREAWLVKMQSAHDLGFCFEQVGLTPGQVDIRYLRLEYYH